MRVWMYTTCVYNALRGQKMMSEPLGTAVIEVVKHRVGSGNRISVVCKRNKCSEQLNVSLALR